MVEDRAALVSVALASLPVTYRVVALRILSKLQLCGWTLACTVFFDLCNRSREFFFLSGERASEMHQRSRHDDDPCSEARGQVSAGYHYMAMIHVARQRSSQRRVPLHGDDPCMASSEARGQVSAGYVHMPCWAALPRTQE